MLELKEGNLEGFITKEFRETIKEYIKWDKVKNKNVVKANADINDLLIKISRENDSQDAKIKEAWKKACLICGVKFCKRTDGIYLTVKEKYQEILKGL